MIAQTPANITKQKAGMANKTLKASVIIGGSISGGFRSAMSSTKTGLKEIGEEIAKVERRQRLLSQGIQTFGKMSRNVDGMRREYSELAREADKLRRAQSRLADVQERIDRNSERRRELGGQLRGAVGAFGVVAAATLAPVRSAASFETAMLGVAKQLEGARDAGGNLTPVYFGMSRQIQQLGREIPIATNELAEMVAAGLRMGVASDEVVGFTRTAAMMADAFEMPAGKLADDMGKIAGLFHIPVPRIGELADAINHLDDNAKSSGGEIIEVMRRVGGMAQALKMPAKEAAALGSTFLTLGSSAEVAGTASNAVMRILGAATAQSKRVRTGMASLGIDPEAIQRSMANDPTGTILGILDKLNALNDEQRMVAATRIFGAEYGDDIAKLATGADEYRRQLALVRGEQAKGSMSREFSARLKTLSAQWEISKNRMREASVVIGNALVPSVSRLMEVAGPMIEGFADWARANPGFVKGIVGSALAVTGLRVAALGAAYAWTAVKGPILSVMGFVARWRATGALAAMGRFGPTAMKVARVVRTIGTAIAAIGGGPIAVAVAALTAGALIVRKYWQPIGAWMAGAFKGVGEVMRPVFAQLGAALAPLKPAWDIVSGAIASAWGWIVKLLEPVNSTSAELAAAGESGRSFGVVLGQVMSVGVRVVTGVVKAVTWLGQAIGTAAGFLVVNFSNAWTKVKSVVGAAVDWIMRRVQPMLTVAGAARDMIANAAGRLGFAVNGDAANAGGRLGAPGTASGKRSPARGRPAPAMPGVGAPGGARVSAGAGMVDSSTHTYHITQQPGESAEALAQRIEADRRRRAGVDRRGSLVDVAA